MGWRGRGKKKPKKVLEVSHPGEEKAPVLAPACPDSILCSRPDRGLGLLSLSYLSLQGQLPQTLSGSGQVSPSG